MKIATVTVHHAHNYGAMLQAYALQKALIRLNYETELVDYDEINSSMMPRFISKSLKGFFSWLFYWIRALFNISNLRAAYRRFEDFYNENLIKSIRYNSIDSINTSDIDMLLVGSDQLWSFKRDGNRPYFQLDFGGNVKRASYAVSMGSFFSLPDMVKENFKKSLENFNVISVRERETAEYIEKLTGKQCCINVDPVFLLDISDWNYLASDSFEYHIPEKYILCYELLGSKQLSECVKRVKSKLKLPVVVLAPTVYYKQKGDFVITNAGPKEMISLIKNASFVITNSFHGTVFSILYCNSFYSVLSSHGPGRIQELLEDTGLGNRIYTNESEIEEKCDFCAAKEYVCLQKKKAYDYLADLKNI